MRQNASARASRPSASAGRPAGGFAGSENFGGGSLRANQLAWEVESLVVADARKLLEEHGLPFTRDYAFVPTGENAFGAVCGGTATVLLEIVEKSPRLLVVGGDISDHDRDAGRGSEPDRNLRRVARRRDPEATRRGRPRALAIPVEGRRRLDHARTAR